ncbi:HAD-IIA family hydrolase [Bifidobacterium sp. ESL0798]|uniref:HAD-IIA family hydrolase n=1 Tax=Bifidobacterium sp. ESL0798 TaxID=2983235 RepID=UPI0023F640ED|nr:HAD-IIA family hydrolase [Bifidobacterium sp. ESL0798]WEV73340.1 HAD-IIA family hydrolase [Bifidobacterium sp. ESL0798]
MATVLKATEQPLEQAYKLALLDLDGVVYRGKNPVDYASESIAKAQHAGMTVEYTTNNSSRYQQTVAQQLRGFGLEVEPWQVITSSVVAARMVARAVPSGAKVLMVGAGHLREELDKQGLVIVDHVEDDPVAVIQGWYPQIGWNELANAAFAIERGAKYFVTNRDLTLPRELGIAPGCGSLINAVVTATGVEPIASAGKPESAMYDEARLLASNDGSTLVPKDHCLAIGDRLDTDIEAGNRGGYDSLVVLTGVADPKQLMLAVPHLRPTYIALDLRDLHETMPVPVQVSKTEWECESASAQLVGNEVRVSDSADINALRAACSLLWNLADNEGVDTATLRLPDFRL